MAELCESQEVRGTIHRGWEPGARTLDWGEEGEGEGEGD